MPQTFRGKRVWAEQAEARSKREFNSSALKGKGRRVLVTCIRT
ncbi:hypothetical protein [Ktedonobacter sp. SOSP1-52]|nr:hypothetical protein [Ktedonobacter sp. SOSP1-52]